MLAAIDWGTAATLAITLIILTGITIVTLRVTAVPEDDDVIMTFEPPPPRASMRQIIDDIGHATEALFIGGNAWPVPTGTVPADS